MRSILFVSLELNYLRQKTEYNARAKGITTLHEEEERGKNLADNWLTTSPSTPGEIVVHAAASAKEAGRDEKFGRRRNVQKDPLSSMYTGKAKSTIRFH
jgi:hypothetical protein